MDVGSATPASHSLLAQAKEETRHDKVGNFEANKMGRIGAVGRGEIKLDQLAPVSMVWQ
jgi:hypothetical protein